MNRSLKALAIGLVLATSFTACRSSEFSTLVRAVGAEPGTRRQYVPMLGLARTGVRTMHPSGVRDFQLAVFETESTQASARLDAALASVGGGWVPMIRVASTAGERTTVWSRPAGDGMEMLILAHEPGESVIVRVEMDAARFFAALADSPEDLARTGIGR
jgi:hypothetical protein